MLPIVAFFAAFAGQITVPASTALICMGIKTPPALSLRHEHGVGISDGPGHPYSELSVPFGFRVIGGDKRGDVAAWPPNSLYVHTAASSQTEAPWTNGNQGLAGIAVACLGGVLVYVNEQSSVVVMKLDAWLEAQTRLGIRWPNYLDGECTENNQLVVLHRINADDRNIAVSTYDLAHRKLLRKILLRGKTPRGYEFEPYIATIGHGRACLLLKAVDEHGLLGRRRLLVLNLTSGESHWTGREYPADNSIGKAISGNPGTHKLFMLLDPTTLLTLAL